MYVKKRRKRNGILLFFILLFLFGLYLYRENTTIGVTFVEIEALEIPESFRHYRIVQLSDIHDSMFGDNNIDLVNKVKILLQDAIFITGDFIDRNRYDLEQSLEIVRQLSDAAPIYFVTGNHEISTNDTQRIKRELTDLGVKVVTDESLIIDKEHGEQL